MSILVTGGTGYIGSHTCVELINAGHDVIVLDNFYNSNVCVADKIKKITNKAIKIYPGDIRDFKLLEKIFSENQIEFVIHFAGLKSVSESCEKPLLYFDNNVNGTINLCNIMQKFAVKNLIFSSSATVYGNSSNAPYKEAMPTGQVCNPYGRTKYFIEEILKDIYASDKSCNITILRYFNPIGAHESALLGENPLGIPNNLMPYIAQVAANKLPLLTVFGDDYNTPDGTCIRDYIHVVDLANGHLKALEKMQSATGRFDIFNLGTGKGYSVLELINTFEKVSGKKINYKIGSRRAGDLPVVYADTQKAEKELGFKAKFDIEKMCLDSWNWQKQN
ncbi:uDP-glucose-4-epimerase [Clostridium sp. CAG:557]|nr:uDP-glucose-4-epimerase [Clostridium sp. CAG:557]